MDAKKVIVHSLIAALLVLGAVSLFPRAWVPVVKAGDSSATDTGVSQSDSTHNIESSATESNQQSLIKSQPIPSPLTYSNERQNLIDKLRVVSKQGLTGYVALVGPQGQLVAYYTVKGKVSSLNSMLTTGNQTQWKYSGSSGIAGITLDSPDLDGSYGPNPSGIFFFTTSGQYIEWSGGYLYSDQPLSYTTQPIIIQQQGR